MWRAVLVDRCASADRTRGLAVRDEEDDVDLVRVSGLGASPSRRTLESRTVSVSTGGDAVQAFNTMVPGCRSVPRR